MIFTRVQFQAWGALGGRMRAQRLSKARRKQIARGAVKARLAPKPRYVKTGKPRGPVGKVDTAKAIEMYKQGKTLVEIGTVFGVTRERIRQKLKAEGITGSDGGQMLKTLLNVENKKENKRKREEQRALRISKTWHMSVEQFDDIVKRFGSNSKEGTPFRRYSYQRRNAYVREIQWNITFSEWWKVWQESGKYGQYGRGQGKYVMSRYGDTGAYEVGNVVIIPSVENNSDRDGKKSGLPIGVSKRKNNRYAAYKMLHGKSNYIGTFDSVEEASEAYLKFKGKRKARK